MLVDKILSGALKVVQTIFSTEPGGPESLLQKAAALGPGYRGRRRPARPDELSELFASFGEHGIEPPQYLLTRSEWIDRRAKLFEAGDYPDKGVEVTEQHLADLATTFDLPVPVLIEHGESPLEIGYLIQVEAVGPELFGTLALTNEANALVERSGAQSLSVGLSADLDEIREVSLVRNPRVETARIFGKLVAFESPLQSGDDNGVDWRARYRSLVENQSKQDAARRVAALIGEGKICPAQAPFAEALLCAQGTVNFSGSTRSVASLIEAFISRQPPMALFGERSPSHSPHADHEFLLPEEADFYRRYFPEIGLDEIAAKK